MTKNNPTPEQDIPTLCPICNLSLNQPATETETKAGKLTRAEELRNEAEALFGEAQQKELEADELELEADGQDGDEREEVDEINDEDLAAAVEFFDRLTQPSAPVFTTDTPRDPNAKPYELSATAAAARAYNASKGIGASEKEACMASESAMKNAEERDTAPREETIPSSEYALTSLLHKLLDDESGEHGIERPEYIQTYREAGVLTNDAGLVITYKTGKAKRTVYHVTAIKTTE